MYMTDGLTAVLTAVVYNAEAFRQIFIFCDFGNSLENLSDKETVFRIYLGRRSDMLLGTIMAWKGACGSISANA